MPGEEKNKKKKKASTIRKAGLGEKKKGWGK